MTSEKIKEIIKECDVCNKKDNKTCKSSKFVAKNRPGELIGIDLIEVNKCSFVIVAVDYFSRKIWAMHVNRKLPEKIKKTCSWLYFFICKIVTFTTGISF